MNQELYKLQCVFSEFRFRGHSYTLKRQYSAFPVQITSNLLHFLRRRKTAQIYPDIVLLYYF